MNIQNDEKEVLAKSLEILDEVLKNLTEEEIAEIRKNSENDVNGIKAVDYLKYLKEEQNKEKK